MNNLQTSEEPANLIDQIDLHLELAKQHKLIPLIAVIGPTASGKTALGIALAQKYSGEIVSADSRQIYQYLNIGTAKPSPTECAAAPHHLIDQFEPDELFSLADYQKLAQATIAKIYANHHLPIIVGGTGLYVNSITQNYALPTAKPDFQLRRDLVQMASSKGNQAVHEYLKTLDPASAAKIHPNNLRYVIRAIEINTHSKQPKQDQINPSPYLTFFISIDWTREELYQRIEARIDKQLKDGLLDETKFLLTKYNPNLPALSSLGYQEISQFINGQISLESAIQQFKQHTRNFAKRQLTWFRKIKPLYSIAGTQLTNFITALRPE